MQEILQTVNLDDCDSLCSDCSGNDPGITHIPGQRI